jgi:hypothetical protein
MEERYEIYRSEERSLFAGYRLTGAKMSIDAINAEVELGAYRKGLVNGRLFRLSSEIEKDMVFIKGFKDTREGKMETTKPNIGLGEFDAREENEAFKENESDEKTNGKLMNTGREKINPRTDLVGFDEEKENELKEKRSDGRTVKLDYWQRVIILKDCVEGHNGRRRGRIKGPPDKFDGIGSSSWLSE